MNLHNIVSGCVSQVNPELLLYIQRSDGYTTADDGSQVPKYLPAEPIAGLVQALQYNDIAQINGLNVTGER